MHSVGDLGAAGDLANIFAQAVFTGAQVDLHVGFAVTGMNGAISKAQCALVSCHCL